MVKGIVLIEMQKFPLIGDRFIKSVPASDNVCGLFLLFDMRISRK